MIKACTCGHVLKAHVGFMTLEVFCLACDCQTYEEEKPKPATIQPVVVDGDIECAICHHLINDHIIKEDPDAAFSRYYCPDVKKELSNGAKEASAQSD